MILPPTVRAAAAALVGALTLTACAVPEQPTGQAGSTELLLADAYELGGYNPVAGYCELGVCPLYDGLMGLRSSGDEQLPELEPRLASGAPEADRTLTTWTVPLRSDVTFHDGSRLDAADVVATYRAVLDPASASELAASLDMVKDVKATGSGEAQSVVFTLKYPYADFPSRLLLGIAPSEKLTGGPVERSTLNTHPVGTGPYRLAELTADKAVLTANEDYFGGRPQVGKVTTLYVPDDNTRIQRLAAGDFDGTIVPPVMAQRFADAKDLQVRTARSADWRGVSLPADNPFTADPAVRVALNLAVDREAMITAVLDGHGSPAHTPVSSVYGPSFNASAVFEHDVERAKQLLAGAGWRPGSDGILTKGGERASFTVAYTPTDTVRRDLATAFAADMRRIGVEVQLEGMAFDRIEPRVKQLGILLGGGERPYSLGTQVFETLHRQIPGTSVWSNPGNHGSAAMDQALEKARRTTDESERARLHRQVQQDYLANPSYVFLVFLEHTYVTRADSWKQGPMVVEPHAHGIGWGPWWQLQAWTR